MPEGCQTSSDRPPDHEIHRIDSVRPGYPPERVVKHPRSGPQPGPQTVGVTLL